MSSLEDFCGMASSVVDRKTPFVETLTRFQRWLDDANIPFVLLGSVPISAHVDAGASAVFDRPGAHAAWQRVPDIDLLTPRKHVERVQAHARDVLGQQDFPVHVDIADGYIDYRPDEDRSYLTHAELRITLNNELLAPRQVPFLGTQIRTVDPRTLLHMFVTIGCTMRDKDKPKVVALAQAIRDNGISKLKERDCSPFHRFIEARKSMYPFFTTAKQVWEKSLGVLPGGARQLASHYLNPVAQQLIRSRKR